MTNGWARLGALAGMAIWLGWQPTHAEGQTLIRLGGTGMALAAMQQLGQQFTATNPSIRVDVLPSLGTPGGLKALSEMAIDVAVAGRRLNAKEKALPISEAACFETPLVFASSHPSPPGVAKADLPGFYTRPDPTWPDGRPLKILLRSRAGSENGYLTAAIPGMAEALEAAYKIPGVPVSTTDQENAELAVRIAGSFAVITLLQIRGEQLKLTPIALDGVAPTPENAAAKTYPLSVQVCLVVPAPPSPAVAKFADYLRSDAGQAMMRRLGATPLP